MNNVEKIIEKIVAEYNIKKAIIFAEKRNKDGIIKSFKVCIITDEHDIKKLEKDIYLLVESDISFDIICYKQDVWDSLLLDKSSFAYDIMSSGVVIYG